MMHVRFPLSLRNVEDLLHERGIDICHESVRHWWNKYGRCSRLRYERSDLKVCVSIRDGGGIWLPNTGHLSDYGDWLALD